MLKMRCHLSRRGKGSVLEKQAVCFPDVCCLLSLVPVTICSLDGIFNQRVRRFIEGAAAVLVGSCKLGLCQGRWWTRPYTESG